MSTLEDGNLTFDQILEIQDRQEEEYGLKQEAIFRRVLDSLHSESSPARGDPLQIPVDPEIEAALLSQKLRRDNLKKSRKRRAAEQREMAELQAQRNALRSRFDPGSLDSQGEDPLAEYSSAERNINLRDEDTTSELINGFSMDNLLSNPYFDQLLESVERDLHLTAPGKAEEGESELASVLRYLETLPPPSAPPPAPHSQPMTGTASSRVHVGQLPPADETKLLRASYTPHMASQPVRHSFSEGVVEEKSLSLHEIVPASLPLAQMPTATMGTITSSSSATENSTRGASNAVHKGRMQHQVDNVAVDKELSSDDDLDEDDEWRRSRERRRASAMAAADVPRRTPTIPADKRDLTTTVTSSLDTDFDLQVPSGDMYHDSFSATDLADNESCDEANDVEEQLSYEGDEAVASATNEEQRITEILKLVGESSKANESTRIREVVDLDVDEYIILPASDQDGLSAQPPTSFMLIDMKPTSQIEILAGSEDLERIESDVSRSEDSGKLEQLLASSVIDGESRGVSKSRRKQNLNQSVAAARLRRLQLSSMPPPPPPQTPLLSLPATFESSQENPTKDDEARLVDCSRKGECLTSSSLLSVPEVNLRRPADTSQGSELSPVVESGDKSQLSDESSYINCPAAFPPTLSKQSTLSVTSPRGHAILEFKWHEKRIVSVELGQTVAVLLDWIASFLGKLIRITGVCYDADILYDDQQSSSSDSAFDLKANRATTLSHRLSILLHSTVSISNQSDSTFQLVLDAISSVKMSPLPLLRDESARGCMVRLLHELPELDISLYQSSQNQLLVDEVIARMQEHTCTIYNPGKFIDFDDVKQWVHIRDGRLACMILKPHVFNNQCNDCLVRKLFGICEGFGLRLCGLRSVYPEITEESKPFHHSEFRRLYNDENLHVVATFVSVKEDAAVHLLRAALGPEDPTLARRTDPESARALLARNKENNLAFPLPWNPENVWRDLLYWIGPRKTLMTRMNVDTISKIVLPETKTLHVGIAITSKCKESEMRALSIVQRESFADVKVFCQAGFRLKKMRTVSCKMFSDFFNGMNSKIDSIYVPSNYEKVDADVDIYGSSNSIFILYDLESELCQDAMLSNIRSLAQRFQQLSVASRQWHVVASYAMGKPLESELTENALKTQLVRTNELALEICEGNFRSHEDVGLPDVAVVIFPLHSPRSFQSEAYTAHPSLNLLDSFPESSFPCILGICWITTLKSIAGEDSCVLICVRSSHLVESIDLVLKNMTNSMYKSEAHVSSCKALLGKAALQCILRNFDLNGCTDTGLSLSDCLNWKMVQKDLTHIIPSWVIAEELPEAELSLDAVAARCLFPPGTFDSISVLFLSWSAVRDKRAFSRTLHRIGVGVDVSLLAIRPCILTENISEILTRDQLHEFGFFGAPDNTSCVGTGYELSVQAAVGSSWISLLLSGNGLLRRLPALIGPVDADLAAKSFPRSLTAALAQQQLKSPNKLKSINSASHQAPSYSFEVISAFSCESAETLAGMIFTDPLELPVESIRSHPVVVEGRAAQKEADFEFIRKINLYTTKDFSLKPDRKLAYLPSTPVTKAQSIMSDITCVLVTRLLLVERGISAVFDAIDREGLKVAGVKTAHLPLDVAKELVETAGLSSLSLKPNLDRLIEGSVLVLALEGSAYAVNRLKSLLPTDEPMRSRSSGGSVWQLEDGSWGALTSASTRLAHNLLLRCFSELHASDWSIVVTRHLEEEMTTKPLLPNLGDLEGLD